MTQTKVSDQEKQDVQAIGDRITKARVEMQASIDAAVDYLSDTDKAGTEAHAYLAQYMDPTKANPDPISPATADPAPAAEPPVFISAAAGTAPQPGDVSGGDGTGDGAVHDDIDLTAVQTSRVDDAAAAAGQAGS